MVAKSVNHDVSGEKPCHIVGAEEGDVIVVDTRIVQCLQQITRLRPRRNASQLTSEWVILESSSCSLESVVGGQVSRREFPGTWYVVAVPSYRDEIYPLDHDRAVLLYKNRRQPGQKQVSR